MVTIKPSRTRVTIDYDGAVFAIDLGVGIPIEGRWRWSFDSSLALIGSEELVASDSLGEFTSLAFIYADGDGPLIRQVVKSYQETFVVVEATALRDLRGIALEDSFFHTTYNAPIVRLTEDLKYLVYTWGLLGGEGPGIAGYFPDVAIARNLAELPDQLRQADFSPNWEVNHTRQKPFAPLICYDEAERTLVMSPLNNYLTSSLRLVETPDGVGVARGLHGSVSAIPGGTTTRTILAFGTGLVATVLKWGQLLVKAASKQRGKPRNSLLTSTLGFWNCYGGYYAELFRSADAGTLLQLSDYFRKADIPVRYWGLDLWYQFDRVGFARNYAPDSQKFPDGLKAVLQQAEIPFLLHMSSFDKTNHYLGAYNMEVEEGSVYPKGPELYQDLAQQFKEWGATGVWHDFLRTLMQNCRSLRGQLGVADKWFDDLVTSMDQEGLDVMLCMPTIGHYMASAAYDNVVAVRTSTDYVNHQRGQIELLAKVEEYRRQLSPQRNLRQNLMLSFLAGALGLAPSYDVFITNRDHPEGFANPNAMQDALVRALSAGIVGVGDKLGQVDREVVSRLAFPDGALAQPDHTLYPVAASLHSKTKAFYTDTVVSGRRWTYVVLVNLSEEPQEYDLDLFPVLGDENRLIYDYHGDSVIKGHRVSGLAHPGEGRYLIAVPKVAGLYPLGFPDKYVTFPGKQFKAIDAIPAGTRVEMELPAGRNYAFAGGRHPKFSRHRSGSRGSLASSPVGN